MLYNDYRVYRRETLYIYEYFAQEVNINVNLCRLIVNSYFNNYNSIARHKISSVYRNQIENDNKFRASMVRN